MPESAAMPQPCPTPRAARRATVALVGLALSLGLMIGLPAGLAGCVQTQTGPVAGQPGAGAPPAAPATPTLPSRDVNRLTALAARAMPLGKLAQISIDDNPHWPFQAAQVSAAQERCVQQRLLPAGFLENRRQAVHTFIGRHPNQVQDAIDVLAQGGADILGASFLAGIQAGHKDSAPDIGQMAQNMTQSFTPAQMSRFLDLAHNGQYRSLRQLLLLGNDQLPGSGDNAATRLIFQKWILEAMGHCRVPLSALP